MMEFNYLVEQGAMSRGERPLPRSTTRRCRGALAQLAKELLEIEATGDRARAEAWFAKYDKMPAALTAALAATKAIPVDVEPVFSFKDDVR